MYFLPLNQTPFSIDQNNASLKRYHKKTEPKPKKMLKKSKKRHFSMKISIIIYLYIYFSMYFLPLNQSPFSMDQKNASFKRYHQKTKPKPQNNLCVANDCIFFVHSLPSYPEIFRRFG